MKTQKSEIEHRMAHFEQVCRSANVKITHQRMEVFREVAQNGHHPDAETVFRGVRRRVPTMSLDTVYRTLWLLSDLGLITRLGPPNDRARFDANLSRHHHFVCLRCGLVRDFYSDSFDELDLPEEVAAIGFVETMHVEAEGICRTCAAQDESGTKTRKERRRS